MLESLVEKLLNKFLAPYVEGIERNLHLGVWSGNIVLENLKLKPQITEILDLSFKIIHGNIGRINIQIPWSKLGKSPVCVLIKNVHIYIKPRSYKKSENVIIEELRRAKMHRLELLEEEISLIKQQKNKEKSSEKSTLIFKLLNKIINNIHVDIQDILIHFEDPERNFSIGFILKSSSVKNCLVKEGNAAEPANSGTNASANASEENKKLNHIIEFKGLCIYSNSNIRKKRRRKKGEKGKTGGENDRNISAGGPKRQATSASSGSLTRGDPDKDEREDLKNRSSLSDDEDEGNDVSGRVSNLDSSSKLKNDLSISYDKNDDLAFESKLGSANPEEDQNCDSKDNYLKRTLTQISNFLKDDDSRILNYYNFEYLIKPFDLVLPVEQSSNKKELKAKLEIGEKWEGITLTRTQITKIIEIMNEANKSRNQTNKLLLKYAYTVKLDIESLRNETKNEFMNLYNKVLAEKYNISTTELTSQEMDRLQILYDVVGVRHLAKWRLQCKNTLEKIIEEKNLKKKYLYDSIYKQQSWWSWVTGNKKDIENKVQSILNSEQDIINEKELYILQEAMTNEDNYDVVLPTKYDFQFKLANFSINVYDDCKKGKRRTKRVLLQRGELAERGRINGNMHPMDGSATGVELTEGTSNPRSNPLVEEISLSGSEDTQLNSSPAISPSNSNYIKKGMKYEEINILSINFYQIYSSLSLQSVVDHNDNDNFQWKFIIELQNFVAKHKNKIFMEFRTNKNLFPYNVNSTGSSLYQNAIYYSLLHSQSLCAYVEINHLVTEKGNTLSTLLRLNPLELYVSPLLIKNILSFAFPLIDIVNKKHKSVFRRGKEKDSLLCDGATETPLREAPVREQLPSEELPGKPPPGETPKSTAGDDQAETSEDDEEDEEALEHIKKMEQTELIEGLKEKGENVYNRAVQHLPELFEFYIHICGPILHFDNLTNGIVELHLGNLIAKTEFPCTYHKFNLIFEFNETQITCLKASLQGGGGKCKDENDIHVRRTEVDLVSGLPPMKGENPEGEEEGKNLPLMEETHLKDSYCNRIKEKTQKSEKFYILQPIPVKVYVEYDLKILRTNIILDGIFFQINPDAVSIILAVPTSITRYLTRFYSKNKKEKDFLKGRKKTSVEKKGVISSSKGEGNICLKIPSGDGASKENNSVSVHAPNDDESKGNLTDVNQTNKLEEESFLYDIDFLIKNSSFSIKNGKNREVLKYEACGISYKNYLQKKKKIVKVEIEQLWICDPSNRQPIFFTLTKNVNSKDIFLFRSLSTYLEEKHNAMVNGGVARGVMLPPPTSKPLSPSQSLPGGAGDSINLGTPPHGDATSDKHVIGHKGDDNTVSRDASNEGNGSGDIDRFQSAERIEEFMESGFPSEGKEFSPSNELDKGWKVRSGSNGSIPNEGGTVDDEEEEPFPEDEEDDDFMDAIEEKQLSINLQILQEQNQMNRAKTHVNLIISDIELHWKYKTIKQIFKTMKEYKKKLQYGIEKDMKYIKNKLKNEEELKNYKMFISEHTLRSVQETLNNVKNSLNILDLESARKSNEEDLKEEMSSAGDGTHPGSAQMGSSPVHPRGSNFLEPMGKTQHMGGRSTQIRGAQNGADGDDDYEEDILSNGLNNTLPKLYGQKNSYVKYFFNCYIKSASLAFWQKRKIFSKIQVSSIYYENKVYLNFDQKMFVNIEKGIISMNSKNIISNNINDYTYDLFISRRSKRFGATDFERVKPSEDSKGENVKTMSERRNSKDILNYINVDNLSEEIKKKKKKSNKQKRQDLFVGKIKVYKDKRNYNICLLCDISSIYYIFYLRDLKLFLEYLDDGILNVFISKSYKKVVQVAQAKYFLFHCTILDPVVIIPEDKNIIYNYRGEVKDVSKISKASINGGANGNRGGNSIPYIESYLKFHLGTLKFKNSYTVNYTQGIVENQRRALRERRKRKRQARQARATMQGRSTSRKRQMGVHCSDKGASSTPDEATENEELEKKEKTEKVGGKYDFTLYVDLLDMESRACENGGSINIQGNILQKVNIGLCLVSTKDGVFIYMNGNDFCLDLTVFQLAFLLDIINENFCYKGYFPMCFICDKGVNIDSMLNAEWFRKGNINLGNLSVRRGGEGMQREKEGTEGNETNSANVEKEINETNEEKELSSPPGTLNPAGSEPVRKNGLKLYLYINLESLKIKTSFDENTPVAIITFQNISISFHLVLLDFYYIYFFDLYSNSLYIDDVRKNSINYYKRVAYCCIENEASRVKRKRGEKYYEEKMRVNFVKENAEAKISLIKNTSVSVNSNSCISNLEEENNLSSSAAVGSNPVGGSRHPCVDRRVPPPASTKDYKGLLRYMFESNVFLSEEKKKKRQKGIKIRINSFIEDIILSIELDDAYICCFFIIFMDIYKFLSTGFNLSTLHLYPKPSPYIVSAKEPGRKKKGKKVTGAYDTSQKDIYNVGMNKHNLKEDKKELHPDEANRYGKNRRRYAMENIRIEEDVFKSEAKSEAEGGERRGKEEKNIPVRGKEEDEGEGNNPQDGKVNISSGSSANSSRLKFIRERMGNEKNQTITNINEILKLDNKPIHISFKVNNGNFIVFTNLENVAHPILLWSNNFVFSFSLLNKCIIFRKIYAINSKIKRINYVSNFSSDLSRKRKTVGGVKEGDPKDVSNPLHNYHKKKILLCDNLNVKGEAIYESVDTKKENYILKANVRKKDYPEFISVFELDIHIGNFDIRLSNDDVEILLRASSTLFGDVPSSYTNIAVGAVIPPVTFIHTKIKNKFMRNNIYFVMKEAWDGQGERGCAEDAVTGGSAKNGDEGSAQELQITNINKLKWKKRRKRSVVMGDLNNEGGAMKQEGDSASEEKLPVGINSPKEEKKLVTTMKEKGEIDLSESSNNVIESFSYNALSEISTDSNLTIYSDSSSTESYTTSRIFSSKNALQNESESDLTNGNEQVKTYRDIKIVIKLHNVKCTFIDDIRNSIVPIIRTIMSMSICLNFYSDECSYNINDLNSKVEYFNNCIGDWEPFLEKCNISLDIHKILPNDSFSEDTESSKSPISIIKINSVNALWFNITPQLVNLLFLFLPVFTDKVLKGLKKKENNRFMASNTLEKEENQESHLSLFNKNCESVCAELDEKKLSIKSKSIYEDCSSVFESVPGDIDQTKDTDIHLDEFLNKEENRNSYDCMRDNSVVYYVNLTSDFFYAFVMPEGSVEEVKKKRPCAGAKGGRGYRIVQEGGNAPTGMPATGVSPTSLKQKQKKGRANLGGAFSRIELRTTIGSGNTGDRVKKNNYHSEGSEADDSSTDCEMDTSAPELYAKIVTTNELVSLDRLLVNEIANNSLIEKKCLYLYLIPIPPTNVVNVIHDMFANVSKRDIVLDLMITKNPKKTIENLLVYTQGRVDQKEARKGGGNDPNLNINLMSNCKAKLSHRVEERSYENNKYNGNTVTDERGMIEKTTDGANMGEEEMEQLGREETTSNLRDNDLFASNDDLSLEGGRQEEELVDDEEDTSQGSSEDEMEEAHSVDSRSSSSERHYFKYSQRGKEMRNSIYASNKFVGPFLRNCECVIINLIKNSCTTLTTSLKSSNVIHMMKPLDYIFDEAYGNGVEKWTPPKGDISGAIRGKDDAALNKSSVEKPIKWEMLNEEMDKQTNMACKYRLKNNYLPVTPLAETVCEIISPMPNYKILFMSSTVRIVNKCGIPLEFCFFDGSRNPILLTSLENRTIPISTLYPNHSDSFKNYKVSNSLNINPNIKLRQKNNNLSFTVILNHEYLLSTPECAFCGPSHVYLSFKPINLVSEENAYYEVVSSKSKGELSKGSGSKEGTASSKGIPDFSRNNGLDSPKGEGHISPGGKICVPDASSPKSGLNELMDTSSISSEKGWSDIFSSDMNQGTYVKKCKMKDSNNYLYFIVKIENKISALPAEKNLKIITIYPHVSVVNAIPALVDIIITSEISEEKQNDYVHEEKGKIDFLKNKKVKLLRQCEEINAYLSKLSSVKQVSSGNSSAGATTTTVAGGSSSGHTNDYILGKGTHNNNERVYIHELKRLEKEISNIDEEIKIKKREISSSTSNKGYVNKRLNPFSIFYIYEIKKYSCLNMKMKIGNSQCEWSDKLFLLEDDEESVMRFSLNFKRFASVEVELIKNFSGYFNSLNSILGNKQLYIFSLPRCFIDRTGLGIKAINSNKYYPIINGITLLGDNSQIDLLLPHKMYHNEYLRSCRNGVRSLEVGGVETFNDYSDIFNDFNYPCPVDNSLILFKATLPPIGSYTETSVVCKNFFYTFCLNTEKIKTTNIPYIISRIITVVPQFIISNKLNHPILVKQFQTDKIQGVRQNDTSPLYFPKKQNILLFRFRALEEEAACVGDGTADDDGVNSVGGYADGHGNRKREDYVSIPSKQYKISKNPFWSSVIFPSENFVGTNYMVVNNSSVKEEKSEVYVITCIPDMGTKNIIIEKLDNNMNKGFIAYNCSSLARYLKIRTFHDDTKHLKMDEEENYKFEKNMFVKNFLSTADMEHYFNIEYDQSSYLGWVNPFIYVTRNVQIEIVLHDMKTIPRTPFILKFAQYNYAEKLFQVYYYDVVFIISIEYIQDLIAIKLTHRISISRGALAGGGGFIATTSYTNDTREGGRVSKNSVDMQEYHKIEVAEGGYELRDKGGHEMGVVRSAMGGSYIQKKMMIGHSEYNYVKYGTEKDWGAEADGDEGGSRYQGQANGYGNYYYYGGGRREEAVKMISNTYKNVHVIINVTQIGVSIISNILKEEVFFIELSKLCALFYMKNEEEVIDIKITDVQVDCQLESCEKCVLLANRGISTNGDKSGGTVGTSGGASAGNSEKELKKIKNAYGGLHPQTSRGNGMSGSGGVGRKGSYMSEMDELYGRKNSSDGINGEGRSNFTNNDMMSRRPTEGSPGIIGKGMNTNDEKIFLNIYVERSFISHKDVIFKKIQISLDDVEIEMDAETLNGINLLIAEYIEGISIVQKKNLLYEEIQKWTILPVYVNYKSPDIPLAINIQYMQIDKFTLIVWCSFLLDKMHMMSDLLRIGLRILMVSGKLELLGAPVTLNQEIFNNIRVSLKSFYALLKDKYSHSILACLGFIVGYSSLINIPKIPLEIGRNTIGLAVYAVDNVSVGIGSFLSNLTFDAEYINRRQKERNFKTNTNMKEGLLSAVKNIGEGVLSLSNIVTKPIEGAQKEGVGGFFKGIGKGVAGSLVKPLDKVGQAVSDVTRGIKAEVSKPIGGHKYKIKRHRKPRMLWGEYGKIKEYNLHEAELRECLGLKFSKNIMKCLTIHKQENHPPAHYSLLLYPKVIIYANLYANQFVGGKNGEFLGEKKSVGGGDIVIWSLRIEDISEIRASSHGVIIRTGNSNNLVYKIPCNNALLINKIYRELHSSKSSINSTIILGDAPSSPCV
ncbi:conserved Plasmodium protein, unknown function [Plasmodium knowlesi strain H]|uniref:Chorein N-terminal domain-containing protein n=3 Tax=Plasmodium knowlesi TaxID=5850 RepID=A0A5K1UFF2_PLAKH|nr:VPS13 domain-containing protein, putative [Plasmodium knowlesi strain H]OTN66525.1 Uncharacterized protein PKNOH_S09544100 [Plasmodium knowlesi]CAA9989872.1 VPS13 domain-containing protein, putative [Plasmodium knowlesi strain H]SBO24431.1 conserved Plasmodium protein, unknown function [Plasmodium knowlesi strain H]SBO26573.1 conserved Plasmodium protein, unknown function [Plasmodium knowlesi strain H]VVS79346.1 VPS13 domain-containing protein, putative [Plasmodium knowlesi strain H]|eukprot:XP_002259888.1 hypothetical protein, conserved in Plasmodium species [Plasmodium knowlesi strain H]